MIRDTWTMTKRSLTHILRSPDTIITVVITPVALLLLFVYVFGGAITTSLSDGASYVNFLTPGIIIMTVVSGIAYAAYRLNADIQRGIINRFRTMPVAPSSILGGQALSSTLSNLVSSLLVLAIAFLVGFRTAAGPLEWLYFALLLTLFTLALTWMAIFFGLLAKSAEASGSFSYPLMLLIFISPSFVPTDSMAPWLQWFAQHQPLTPIVETMRSLLTLGTIGDSASLAIAWSAGLLAVFSVLALRLYRTRSI